MNEYTITCYLLNGQKNKLTIKTDSIAHTIREIEDTYDSLGMPVEEITYDRN